MLKHTFFIITLSLMLISNALCAEIVLTEEEVLKLISGNTIKGIYLDQKIPFESYFDPDGTVYQNRDGESFEGKWFVDKQGTHCVKWQGKEPKCRIVVRDNEQYKEFIINKKTGKRDYSLIINKVIEGSSEGLQQTR